MPKPTLLALCGLFQNQMDALKEKYNVVLLYEEIDPEQKLNEVKDDVRAILATMHNPVRSHLMSACPQLEIVCCKSVGYDNVDIEYAQSNHIKVTNTPDLVTSDTADTAMGLLINLSRRYVELDAYTRVGRWKGASIKPLGRSLTHKKIGIVGLGRIGLAIAKRCQAFDMQIVYHTRTKKDNVSYDYYDDLTVMAKDVDYMMVVVPGGDETENLINSDVLAALGPKSFLINVSRGSVVDESALVKALQQGLIAGAGLDVYQNEPNVPDELKTMDNVVLLPHVGAATYETMGAMGDLILENLQLHFDGKPVKTPVV